MTQVYDGTYAYGGGVQKAEKPSFYVLVAAPGATMCPCSPSLLAIPVSSGGLDGAVIENQAF